MSEQFFIFTTKKKQIKFSVKHNLEEFGLDIESAFYNWLERTETFTAKDFCRYVVSKDKINLKCKPV